MKWNNLKQNKCPQCNKSFGNLSFSKRLNYIVCDCGFQINNKRFSEIVNSMVNKDIEETYEGLEEENVKW